MEGRLSGRNRRDGDWMSLCLFSLWRTTGGGFQYYSMQIRYSSSIKLFFVIRLTPILTASSFIYVYVQVQPSVKFFRRIADVGFALLPWWQFRIWKKIPVLIILLSCSRPWQITLVMKGGALPVLCCVAFAGLQTAFGFLPVATPYRARGKYICCTFIVFCQRKGHQFLKLHILFRFALDYK